MHLLFRNCYLNMKYNVAGKYLLTVFKYSGLAPFDVAKARIKINKSFHLYSKIFILIFCGLQLIISEVLCFYFKMFGTDGFLKFFLNIFTTVMNSFIITTIMIILHYNIVPTCCIWQDIIKCFQLLILNTAFKFHKVYIVYVVFIFLLMLTAIYFASDSFFVFNNFGPQVSFLMFLINYYDLCYHFYFICIALNIYNLLRALNEGISVSIINVNDFGVKRVPQISSVNVKSIKRKIRKFYWHSSYINDVGDAINKYFSKTNFLCISFNAFGIVFTVFYVDIVPDDYFEVIGAITSNCYYITFHVIKTVIFLYFSLVVEKEVRKNKLIS